MQSIVVDFSGFYHENEYIVKEFVVAHVTGSSIQIDDQVLIDTSSMTTPSDLINSSVDFRFFFNKYRINLNKTSAYTRNDLVAKINTLRSQKLPIYLRNHAKTFSLAHYMNLSLNPFKSLVHLGFDSDYQIMRTNCANHQSKDSYCVKTNVMIMADWLKENLRTSTSMLSRRLAVIEIIEGDCTPEINTNWIKSLRVCCFDINGVIIANKVFVSATLHGIRNVSNEEIVAHAQRYVQQHGVDWGRKSLGSAALKNPLKQVVASNNIEIIFVESIDHKDLLNELIGSELPISILMNFGYKRREDHGVKSMMNWVLKKKLYLKHWGPPDRLYPTQTDEIISISSDDDEEME